MKNTDIEQIGNVVFPCIDNLISGFARFKNFHIFSINQNFKS